MRAVSSALVLAANGQLIPGLGLLPQSIQNTVINTVKSTVESVAGVSTEDYVSDEALLTILTDSKTTDPLSWDAEFLTPLVENVPNGDNIIAYTEIAQGFAEDGIDALASVGITSPADLSSETMASALSVIVDSNPQFEEVLMSTFNGDGSFTSVDEILVDLTAGFDDVKDNYGPTLEDPANWSAETFTNIMTDYVASSAIASSVVTTEMINSAATYADTGLTMATDAGLADLSSENLLAELTAPLEVCYGTLDAAQSLGVETLKGILKFDAGKFMESLSKLIGDGVQCYEAYSALTAGETPANPGLVDQILEYVPYPFMALEKYYKVSDLAEDLSISYKHLIADTKGYFMVYGSITEESYIEYARFISRAIQDNLYPKFSSVMDVTRITYNTLLEDIPVVENYQLSELDMQKYLVIANNHLTYLVDGLTTLDKMGFGQVEKIICKNVNKSADTQPDTAVKQPETTTSSTTTTTGKKYEPFTDLVSDISHLDQNDPLIDLLDNL